MKKLILFILLPLFLAGLFIAVAFIIPVHDSPPPSGWYQQFMPNLNNKQLKDITFIDSLIGYAITGYTTVDTNYILKTSNGGDNWSIINIVYTQLTRIQFLNTTTGFISGGNIQGGYLIKTTDGGLDWNFVPNSSFTPRFEDISVLNEDTIWCVSNGGINGGIFCTTNGGLNWNSQFYQFNNNPKKIYMYNRNIGFACTDFELFKTTNSGTNWVQISGSSQSNQFRDMYFADSMTGWKCSDSMRMTTNGGLNWRTQILPFGGLISTFGGMAFFSNINRDTIWGAGGFLFYGGGRNRGILYRTTNAGDNWYFQIPDTSFGIQQFAYIDFINKNTGWAYVQNGIHTTTGGDTVWYIGIVQQSKEVPKDFILKQNYPNPFNPRTVIPYSLKSAGYVRIIAYDILGREVQRLVDQKQSAGEYEVDFMGKFCSSGVYFYSMTVDGNVIGTRTMVLLK